MSPLRTSFGGSPVRVGVLLFLLHALQIRDDALGFAARLLHDAAGVRLGFLDGVLALVFHLLAELLGLVAQLDRLGARLTRNLALAFRNLPDIFRIGESLDSSFFASSMRFSGSPRRRLISKALDLPGTPIDRR